MSDAPAAVAVPQAPVTPPAPPASPPNVMGQLKPEDPILVRDKTGQHVTAKLGDLADAWRNRPEAADMEDLGLLRKAIKENDVEAAQKLVSKYTTTSTPAATPTPSSPANAEMQALQAEMKSLKESLAKISPTTDSVRDALVSQQLTQAVDAAKDKVPLLVQHPERASLLRSRLEYYDGQARAHKLDGLDALPVEVRRQVLEKAMADVEGTLRSTLEIYKVKPNGQTPARNITSVNDQTSPDAQQVRPARYSVVDGKLVDAFAPVAAAPVASPLPSAPVTPVPSGGMVGVDGGAKPGGRMTPQQLMDTMRARSNVLSQTV